jgi:hypothetical protein
LTGGVVILGDCARARLLIVPAHVDGDYTILFLLHQVPVAVIGEINRLAGDGVGDADQPVLDVERLGVDGTVLVAPGHIAVGIVIVGIVTGCGGGVGLGVGVSIASVLVIHGDRFVYLHPLQVADLVVGVSAAVASIPRYRTGVGESVERVVDKALHLAPVRGIGDGGDVAHVVVAVGQVLQRSRWPRRRQALQGGGVRLPLYVLDNVYSLWYNRIKV